ncbi:MAG TPA: hypothetical protein PKL52_03480 [Tenuifilaceae bacterium]|nr:hypothetical protein [Tenuifilaceae bacterium]
MKKLITILVSMACFATIAMAQHEMHINDVYFDRFFRKVIIDAPPADAGTTDLAEIYGQRNKTGIEGFIMQKKYPGFAVIAEQKWKKRLNWNYGYMLYKRPVNGLPGSDMMGHIISGGLSLYTRYLKVYAGGMFRYGYNPQLVETQDSTYWEKDGGYSISPFLYFDYPFKKFFFSGNILPAPNLKSLARVGLKFGLRYLSIRNDVYADRVKAPYGYDYDGGYDFRYIFKDPMGGNSDGYYVKLRLGKAFSVDERVGMTFNDQIKNNDNAYVQLESAFWYVLGFNYHKTEGFGWRAGLDFKVDRYKIVFSYQNKYIMQSSFGNQPDKNLWFLSLIIN